jgi:hypothetical protein
VSIRLFESKEQTDEWTLEATMEEWKDFSARQGHCLAHYLELLDEAERLRRIRAVLASGPRKARFFARALAALGRRMVRWGARLHARYDEV